MDYEKKYKEALERAREQYNKRTHLYDIEFIFPELKESEDERIRKAIYIYLDWLDGRKDYAPKGIYTIKDMIAWLEKQGENKKLDADKVVDKTNEKNVPLKVKVMTIKELMIGDWVLMKNKPYKVASLSSIGNPELESDKYIFHCLKDEIAPISLTPEIFEKNGFVKYNEVSDTPPYDQDEEGNMYYSYKGEHKFWGWWQPNNVYYIPINAMLDLEIKYVHQLQHAMRLCGIDKEIEL